MENAATIKTLHHEIGLVLQGLLDAGYEDQFERMIYVASSDFHVNFPQDKEFFAIFIEDRSMKYFAFDDKEKAEKIITTSQNELGNNTIYKIVPRSVAEMLGREHEYYQYRMITAESDDDAEKFAIKQQEIIDFLFQKP